MSSSSVRTTKYTYRTTKTTGGDDHRDVTTLEYGTDLGALTRIEDKMKLLQEDLEFERELRQRIEREKSDLSVHLIQITEKLEEAAGSSETHMELNKKRDTELSKLRKLLEDVHLESEETAHMMRKKHQESIADFQDQVDQLNKHKSRVEKEKQKFQSEMYELLAQVESVSKEKLTYQKTIERLEITIHELNIRLDETSRAVTEVTSQRARVSAENADMLKEIQEYRASLDTVNHIKSQLAAQLEETRRQLEDEERRRSNADMHGHTLELELESIRVQFEEETEFRMDIERQLVKANSDIQVIRSKYETEVQNHTDEVDELRRKFGAKSQEYEEQLESLLNKCSNLEKNKSRLQSEIEVLIMDLEKSTSHAQTLEKRCVQVEKINVELKIKIDDLVILLDNSQRDVRNKQAELQKLQGDYDKTREQRDLLMRENKKFSDDLHETKNALGEANRRLHELEIEIKRIENEREELNLAYREAEGQRKQEETRAQRLTAELAQTRHEYDRRLSIKDEEFEALKKQTQIEMDQMSQRVAEAEAKLKTEVARIKKKMQIQITELEMSLDVSNKTIIDLQKTIKKQSLSLMEIQAHYDEIHRQLQQTTDQLGISQRRCQSLMVEIEELRVTVETIARGKRVAEQLSEDCQAKINELSTININLISIRTKMEAELTSLHAEYEEVHKELRIVDERYNRTLVDLKATKDVLIEEQERNVKMDSIKKNLEIEVRNLQIRIEEVEANALAGGKRIVTKLESRIRDIEIELEEEKRRHAESQKILRKKDHRVKELILQTEEDHKTLSMLSDVVDKLSEKVKVYKRQLSEQEGVTQQNLTRVRRFQRELEAAEERAEMAESNLSMVRAKHRTWVTTSTVPAGTMTKVTVTEEETMSQF